VEAIQRQQRLTLGNLCGGAVAEVFERVSILPIEKFGTTHVFIEGNELSESEEELLAKRDGFKDFAEMIAFWRANNGLPFEGQIIHWRFDGKKNHDRRI
jgi:hypothetical protein